MLSPLHFVSAANETTSDPKVICNKKEGNCRWWPYRQFIQENSVFVKSSSHKTRTPTWQYKKTVADFWWTAIVSSVKAVFIFATEIALRKLLFHKKCNVLREVKKWWKELFSTWAFSSKNVMQLDVEGANANVSKYSKFLRYSHNCTESLRFTRFWVQVLYHWDKRKISSLWSLFALLWLVNGHSSSISGDTSLSVLPVSRLKEFSISNGGGWERSRDDNCVLVSALICTMSSVFIFLCCLVKF